MNIEKRIVALRAMNTRLNAYATKAAQIADELTNSFSGDRSDDGKKARAVAKIATRLSKACKRTAVVVKI